VVRDDRGRVSERRQDRSDEALDLDRTGDLPPETLPEPVRGENRKGREDGGEGCNENNRSAPELGLPPPSQRPHGRERNEHDGEKLDRNRKREQKPAQAVALA
jgi:hypothetical protein